AYPTSAVTLQEVLRTTLERNPAILEAKAGLEQAAGQRLVFRSIVWPDFDVLVPAGVQYGHRAGESGVKGFAVGRGNLEQTLFNMAVPHSLRRGDIEVLIAQPHPTPPVAAHPPPPRPPSPAPPPHPPPPPTPPPPPPPPA